MRPTVRRASHSAAWATILVVFLSFGCVQESSEPNGQRPSVSGAAKQGQSGQEKVPQIGPREEPAHQAVKPATSTEEDSLESPATKESGVNEAASTPDDTAKKETVESPENIPETAEDEFPQEPKPVDLGPPLVEVPEKLIPLNPAKTAFIDKEQGRILMVGQVCQRAAPLEMFVCPKNTKEHESIVSVDVSPAAVHAGLIAVGAKPGKPVSFDPDYQSATGTVIGIEVRWKDAKGAVQKARAQEWIRDYDTKQEMRYDWVFAGSRFWTDEATGQKIYLAEHGDFICVANFPTAMLDLPVRSSDQASDLLFEAFTERIPPLGTPVTVILVPKTEPEKAERPSK